ncbi:MAG: ATP-grasp domain-containing protein, partial [Clostridiaceae bacterium]|nr:ATP-grasp domain-containing protein [Clostridiaceae bacterium]
LGNAFKKDKKNPILIDKYLTGMEIEVDVICDGSEILIPGIMEHLERAGIHSGDSITIYPSQNISKDIKEKILEYSKKLASELQIIGMMNIQFIESKGKLYIIEVNPRASRTVPYISKVSGVPIIELATRVMLGEKLRNLGFGIGVYCEPKLISVKVPVFSTQKLPEVEVCLGPEMRSTGEVLGIGRNVEEALYKGFVAAGMNFIKESGLIFAAIGAKDKEEFLPLAKSLIELNYKFIATAGTAKLMQEEGLDVVTVEKNQEGTINIPEILKTKELCLVINTPTKGNDLKREGFRIRRTALERSIGVITTLDTVRAMVNVIKKNIMSSELEVFNIEELDYIK